MIKICFALLLLCGAFAQAGNNQASSSSAEYAELPLDRNEPSIPDSSTEGGDPLGSLGRLRPDIRAQIFSLSSVAAAINLAATNKDLNIEWKENAEAEIMELNKFRGYNDDDEMDQLLEKYLVAKGIASSSEIQKAISVIRFFLIDKEKKQIDEQMATHLQQRFPNADGARIQQAVEEARGRIKRSMGKVADQLEHYNDDEHMDKEIGYLLDSRLHLDRMDYQYSSVLKLVRARQEMYKIDMDYTDYMDQFLRSRFGSERLTPTNSVRKAMGENRRRVKLEMKQGGVDGDSMMAQILKPIVEQSGIEIEGHQLVERARWKVTFANAIRNNMKYAIATLLQPKSEWKESEIPALVEWASETDELEFLKKLLKSAESPEVYTKALDKAFDIAFAHHNKNVPVKAISKALLFLLKDETAEEYPAMQLNIQFVHALHQKNIDVMKSILESDRLVDEVQKDYRDMYVKMARIE